MLLLRYTFFVGIEKNKLNKSETTEIMKRWEVSLMSSISFAQLFLHICTLGEYFTSYINILL